MTIPLNLGVIVFCYFFAILPLGAMAPFAPSPLNTLLSIGYGAGLFLSVVPAALCPSYHSVVTPPRLDVISV